MTGTAIVQGPSTIGRTPDRVTVGVGDSATAGICNCGTCEFDLRIANEAMPPVAGRISAHTGFWTFSNLSAETQVTVTNMDDWYQYIAVEPGGPVRSHRSTRSGVQTRASGRRPDGTSMWAAGLRGMTSWRARWVR